MKDIPQQAGLYLTPSEVIGAAIVSELGINKFDDLMLSSRLTKQLDTTFSDYQEIAVTVLPGDPINAVGLKITLADGYIINVRGSTKCNHIDNSSLPRGLAIAAGFAMRDAIHLATNTPRIERVRLRGVALKRAVAQIERRLGFVVRDPVTIHENVTRFVQPATTTVVNHIQGKS